MDRTVPRPVSETSVGRTSYRTVWGSQELGVKLGFLEGLNGLVVLPLPCEGPLVACEVMQWSSNVGKFGNELLIKVGQIGPPLQGGLPHWCTWNPGLFTVSQPKEYFEPLMSVLLPSVCSMLTSDLLSGIPCHQRIWWSHPHSCPHSQFAVSYSAVCLGHADMFGLLL